MNVKLACEILDLNESDIRNIDEVKKKYRMHALLYHPDKNKSPDACDKFIRIQEAYEFLTDNKLPSQSYKDMLADFLNSVGGKNPILVQMIINKLSQICEDKLTNIIKSIDKNTLIEVYKVLLIYKDILFISDNILDDIKRILIDKSRGDEVIILNPMIDDLLGDNVYKYTIDDQIYLIPLWHRELVYDNSGNDLYVKCNPILPDNIEIDRHNNLYINVRYKIKDVLGKDIITIYVGSRELNIQCNTLKIASYQSVIFANCGIPHIQTKYIYDVSKRGNMIVNIHLL
jgi:hypothetical protein